MTPPQTAPDCCEDEFRVAANVTGIFLALTAAVIFAAFTELAAKTPANRFVASATGAAGAGVLTSMAAYHLVCVVQECRGTYLIETTPLVFGAVCQIQALILMVTFVVMAIIDTPNALTGWSHFLFAVAGTANYVLFTVLAQRFFRRDKLPGLGAI